MNGRTIAHGLATLRLPAAGVAGTAYLVDALGRPVRAYTMPAAATEIPLDLRGLAPGLYVLRCGAASGKLMVE